MVPEPDPTPHPLDRLTSRGAADAPALTVGQQTLTYSQLEELVGRTAAGLVGHGLAPGDRVASWMAKTILACVLPLACARAGLVHVPVNPVLKRAQVAHILADSGAKLLIANQARLATLSESGDARLIALEDWEAGDHVLPPSSAPAVREVL